MKKEVDLSGGWDRLWHAGQAAAGKGLLDLLTTIGVLLVVSAIVSLLWSKRKGGGGGNMAGFAWTLVIGSVLAAPGFLIPILLNIADFIANFAISIFKK